MMEAVCDGKIDPKIIKQVQSGRGSSANSAAKFFVRNKLDYPNNETQRASRKYVKAMKHLNVSWLHSNCGELLTATQEFIPSSTPFNKQLLDLLRKIFVYDPKQRITAKQALKHPWFKESIVDDGTEALRIRDQREEDSRQAKRLREM